MADSPPHVPILAAIIPAKTSPVARRRHHPDGAASISPAGRPAHPPKHTPHRNRTHQPGATPPGAPAPKESRSYFVWEYGKAPDLVVEIVSNRKGNELGDKLLDYALAGVGYYVVFDPFQALGQGNRESVVCGPTGVLLV